MVDRSSGFPAPAHITLQHARVARGQNPDFLLGAARPLPPSADIDPGGQPVGQAAQFCLGRGLNPLTGTHPRVRKFGRTSAPRLPQTVQTKPGSISDSLTSSAQRSALISTWWLQR